jgi:hypothetical protein
MTTRTKRIWKILAIVVAVIAALYIGLTVWSFVALHRAYAALARDGRPMTAAEVIPPPVPAAENAAPLYEEAIQLLKAEKIGDSTLMEKLSLAVHNVMATNATPADVTLFRELVTRPAVQHALALVVQADERKTCCFDLNYKNVRGYENVRESFRTNLFEITTLSKVVRGEVNRLADTGEYSNAWRMAIAGLRLAQARRSEPVLISQLVTILLESIADISVRRLCVEKLPSQEDMDRIFAALKSMDQPAEYQRVFDGDRLLFGERGFVHATRKEARLGWTMAGVPPWEQRLLLCIWRPVLRFDYAAYLRMMRDEAAIPLPMSLPEFHVPEYYCFTHALQTSLEHSRTQFIIHVARIRCTEAGLAVLAYKKEHGAWPETLAVCMDQVPVDPFDDKPLRYRVTGKGFVVSSVGKIRNTKEIAWECEPDNVR